MAGRQPHPGGARGDGGGEREGGHGTAVRSEVACRAVSRGKRVETGGWTRSLDEAQQRALEIDVDYWRVL